MATELYGADLAIEAFSTIVLLILMVKTLSFSRIKSGKFKELSAAFLLLTAYYLSKLAVHFFIYTSTDQIETLDQIVTANTDPYHPLGLFVFGMRIIAIIAFYMLYAVYSGKQNGNMLTIFLFLLIAFMVHATHLVYHLAIVAIMIALIIRLIRRYNCDYTCNRKLLISSFIGIALSHAIFMFIDNSVAFYVIAEIAQLVGFVLLLVTMFKVVKDAKKG